MSHGQTQNHTHTHNNQWCPAMLQHTCTVPARSSFFHPVGSNPLLSTAVRDANKNTNKQSDELTWRLRLGFCFIFFFLVCSSMFSTVCETPSATHSFMETQWGGNLTYGAGLFCQACDQPLCVCIYVCVYLYMHLGRESLFVCVCVCVGSLTSSWYILYKNYQFQQKNPCWIIKRVFQLL